MHGRNRVVWLQATLATWLLLICIICAKMGMAFEIVSGIVLQTYLAVL